MTLERMKITLRRIGGGKHRSKMYKGRDIAVKIDDLDNKIDGNVREYLHI